MFFFKQEVKKEMQDFQRKFFIVLIAVVFVAITAAGAGVYWSKKMNVEKSMADRAVQPQKPFEGDGGSYRTFVNSTAEGHTVYVRYYFFNLTNGPSVVAGAPPKFTTVGPYTYQKIKTCFDVVFQDGNGTVRFKEHTKHMWIPELSKSDTDGRQLSEDDIIVQMNMPLYRLTATAAMQCAAGNTTLWSSLNSIMERTGSSLFVPRKVHAHLWGYDDALLRALGQPSHHHGFFTQDSQDTMDTEKRTGSMGLGTSSQFTMIKVLGSQPPRRMGYSVPPEQQGRQVHRAPPLAQPPLPHWHTHLREGCDHAQCEAQALCLGLKDRRYKL